MKWFSLALSILFSSALVHAAGETLSPNMSLPVPGVGVTSGPDWAQDINVSLGIIDGHDHSPGNGVQITPSGINISSDLGFNNTNVSLPRSVRYTSQSSPISGVNDISASYVSAGDLYFNDGAGNQVRITQGGSLAGAAGTITGLPSGTASAAYSSGQGTFVFQQATSTPANMDIGSLILRYPGSYPSPAGNYISLQAPSSLASGYALTFPNSTPISSGAMLTSDNTGALSYTNVDNSSLQNSAGVISVKDQGITTAKIADGNVTFEKMHSNSVGTDQIIDSSVTIPKQGPVDTQGVFFSQTIPAASGTINVATIIIAAPNASRPILVFVTANGSGNGAVVPSDAQMNFTIIRDGSIPISAWSAGSAGFTSGTAITFPLSFSIPDSVSTGPHSYTLQASLTSGTGSVSGVLAAIQI